jgi:hypothetical protein
MVNSRPLPENRQRQFVALLAVAADQLGALADRQVADLVVLELGQPVRQQVVLDTGQRGHALRVTPLAAVAGGCGLTRVQQAVQRDGDVAQLSGHPGRALDHSPGVDQPAAQPGAHDRGQ